MNTITEIESQERIEKMRARLGEMIDLGRMRSDFALRHFVVGQHDTPGKQRAQALAELQALFFSLADIQDEIEITQIDIDEIPGNDKRSKIERRKKERQLMSQRIHMHQRMKEVDCLLAILDSLPTYSQESLEAEEPIYWAARLSRQAFLSQRDPGGNLDAMLQTITIPGKMKPTTPLSPEVFLKSLGIPIEQIAAGLRDAGMITDAGAQKMIEQDQTERQAKLPDGETPSSPRRKRR